MEAPLPPIHDPETDVSSQQDIEVRLARLEAAVGGIARVEDKIDRLTESLAGIGVLEARQSDHRTSMNAFGARIDDIHAKVDDQGVRFSNMFSLARGAVIAATVFWFVLQGAVATLINKMWTLASTNANLIAANHHDIQQLRETQAKLTNGFIDSRFILSNQTKARRHSQSLPGQ